MKIAINQATTMASALDEDIHAYAAAGFEAFELWIEKLDSYVRKESLSRAKRMIADSGLTVPAACFHYGIMLSKGQEHEQSFAELKRKLELCRDLEIPLLVIAPDFPQNVTESDYARTIENFRKAAQMAQEFHMRLALEFIQSSRLIHSLATALYIIEKTGMDNTGVLIDTFHFHTGPSKIDQLSSIDAKKIFLVHVNDLRDVRVEIAADCDRVWPGEGVLPLHEMLSKIIAIGYQGYFSLELFDPKVQQMDVRRAAEIAYTKMQTLFRGLRDA